MKDDYKKLSHEWGSKSRKADSRSAKSTLRKPSREDLVDLHFKKIQEAIYTRMSNPAMNCERCGFEITPDNRQWDGNNWLCDECAEATQQ